MSRSSRKGYQCFARPHPDKNAGAGSGPGPRATSCSCKGSGNRLHQRRQSVGRPCSLSGAARAEALKALSSGSTVTQVARALNTSTQTIMRIRNAEMRPQ
ncbi:helix-turn-helix domain-containing protein [Caballeronia arvi]|uniref:helix-turn-helix domain-containing protein n=1 Tax=Caballeronia arvi TaxID=1777135 RepID=UPI00389942AA